MSGSISSVSTLLTEFADGQAQGAIVPGEVRNIIASVQAGTTSTLRTVTASGPISMLVGDSVIAVALATPAAVTVTLYNAPVTAQEVTIMDQAGNAATYPITITPSSGLINGASSFLINENYGSVTLKFLGTNWGVK